MSGADEDDADVRPDESDRRKDAGAETKAPEPAEPPRAESDEAPPPIGEAAAPGAEGEPAPSPVAAASGVAAREVEAVSAQLEHEIEQEQEQTQDQDQDREHDEIPPAPMLPERAPKGRSLWDEARRRFRRNPAAVISLYVVGALVALAAFGPLLWVHDVGDVFADEVASRPTLAGLHVLGTDTDGHDMLARVLFGLAISLLVALGASAAALAIGVLWGAAAGLIGGAFDKFMMRVVDTLHAIPLIFFVIFVMAFARGDSPFANLMLIFVAIGAIEWLTTARLVRGHALALRNREFVDAARASGAGPMQIVARHIAPNVLGPVIVCAALNVPVIILAESLLSFLGLGVQEPLTSLGKLIAEGVEQMRDAPWALAAPAAAMVVTLLALNVLGEGLRDALEIEER